MSVEIKLSRSNRIYRPNEPVEGKIVTKLSSSISHQGIRLKVNASVNLQVRGGSAGVIESFYGVIKPITILNKTIEVLKSGRISSGSTEIPFSFWLKDPGEKPLENFYETYHGGDISIQYLVSVDISRGYLHKSLSATMEFIIESEKENLPEKPISPEMVIFYMTQDTQRHSLLPELKSGGFRVSGKMCTLCSLSDPIEDNSDSRWRCMSRHDSPHLHYSSPSFDLSVNICWSLFHRVQSHPRNNLPVRAIEGAFEIQFQNSEIMACSGKYSP